MKIRPKKDGAPAAATNKEENKAESTLSSYDEHTMSLEELYERYPTFDVHMPSKSPGLTARQAEERLAIDGPVQFVVH
jgi:hypothetical protein